MSRIKQLVVLALTAGLVGGLHAGPGCKRAPSDSRRPRPAATGTSQARRPTPAATAAATTTTPARPVMRRVHVFITGRVQGVGFRAFTRWNALPLKVTGWVKNLRDGRVEGVFEGAADKVAKLLEKVKTGPPRARVADLKVTDEPATGKLKGFAIRY